METDSEGKGTGGSASFPLINKRHDPLCQFEDSRPMTRDCKRGTVVDNSIVRNILLQIAMPFSESTPPRCQGPCFHRKVSVVLVVVCHGTFTIGPGPWYMVDYRILETGIHQVTNKSSSRHRTIRRPQGCQNEREHGYGSLRRCLCSQSSSHSLSLQ